MLVPALAALTPWMPARVNASVQSSSTCAAGVGVGGVNNATASLTAGGDGCVVIKYSNGATVNYETFNFTGADQTWTVPSGVSSARFFLLGGGGGGVPMAGNYGDGGGGGYAAGTREVTSGEVFTVIVGHGGGGELLTLVSGAGTNGCYRSGFVYGGGGEGASCTSGFAYADRASSGGGRSAIRLANATEIVTAAGGGGGGWTSNGGPGGGTSGGASLDAGGGTQIGGGTTANARTTPGAQFTGGNGFHQGGGGGGGFFGGGGGNSLSGGGGGSSYIALVGDGVTFAGSGTNPGGEINSLAGTETTCANNAGRGGAVSSTLANTLGGNGCVALKYDDANSTIYETFNYTGADQTWVVPSGVTSVTFFLVGAGGGGATALSHGAGGGGGFTRGTYAVTPGDSFIVIVGQAGGGELGVSGTATSPWGGCLHTGLKFGGGGQGGSCAVPGYAPGTTPYSSGGGRSAIRLAEGTSDIATAGGGGGGGYGSSSNGGGGGGTTGIDGGGQGGKGGTQIAGGARGSGRNNGTAGIAYLGGRGDDDGGGGGGGYFGGGGAGDNGGGGGGSSYAALLTNSATVAGSGVNPGGNINTLATADITPPTVTLAATSSTSTVGTITFTVTGNEPINCATLSTTAGTDFALTGISSISLISQTSATVCTVTALSTAINGGPAITSTLTRASTFSITDSAGNAQTALAGSPQSTVVTIPDTIAPTVSFTAVATTAATRAVAFRVTGNEAIDCATLSVINGEDFVFTNISEITSIVQTSPTVCTVNGRSTAINGGGSVTSTLAAASTFSITDVAGNAQTTLSGSPKSVTVTVPILGATVNAPFYQWGGGNWNGYWSCSTNQVVVGLTFNVNPMSWGAKCAIINADLEVSTVTRVAGFVYCPDGLAAVGIGFITSGATRAGLICKDPLQLNGPYVESSYIASHASPAVIERPDSITLASGSSRTSLCNAPNISTHPSAVTYSSLMTGYGIQSNLWMDGFGAQCKTLAAPVAPRVEATLQPSGNPSRHSVLTSQVAISGFETPTLSYQWQRCSSPTDFSSCVDVTGATASTYTLTTNDIGYYMRTVVTGVNSEGTVTGTSSMTAQVVGSPPDVPTSLSAESLDSSARISFTAGQDGGSPITNYMYSLNGGPYVALNPADGTSPITIPGLTNGTTYTVALKAVNAAGTSNASTSVTVTPVAAPSAPTNVSATLENAQSTVSWDASVNNGGSTIIDYVVTASPGGNTCTTPDASTHTCVVTGLTNGITYTFSVVARNAVGDSPNSTSSLPTTPRTIPDAPTNVTGVVGNTESYVSWSASADNGGSAILNYVVTASPGGRTCTTPDGATLSCVVTGLTNGTAYAFTVNAFNAAGYSPGAMSITTVTPSAITAPSRPVSISASVSNGVATLSWSAPSTDGGSPIIDYAIEYSTDGGTTWQLFNDGVSTATSATLTGLTTGQSYHFRVTPINSVGHGITSPITGAVVVASVPPSSQNSTPPVAPSVTTPVVVAPAIFGVQQNTPNVVIPIAPTTGESTTTTTTLPNTKISQLNDSRTQIRDNIGAVSGMTPGGWVKVTPSGTKVVLTTSDGLRIEIGAQKGAGRNVRLNSRGMVVVEHGDAITIGGAGLAPNSEASTWLFSTPRLLGILTVDANGAFSERYTIGEDVEPGDHTSQINGLAPDGTLRSVEVAVEVMAAPVVSVIGENASTKTKVVTDQEPFDPLSDIDGLLSLFATALVLTAVAGASQAGRKRDEEREAAEVSEVSVKWGSAGVSEHTDRLTPLTLRWLDSFSVTTPLLFARRIPVLARICADGSYLRALLGALWLVMPLLAVVVGISGAQSTGGEMLMPALWILIALLVLGIFDALSGVIAVVTFGILVLLQGGFSSSDSVRGFLGLLVFGFGVALVASATRPFRRKPSDDVTAWVRITDLVLLPLFGAWAAGGMFSALPGLTGFIPTFADRTTLIQVIALLALLSRFVLENATLQIVPMRLRSLENEVLPEPSVVQKLLSMSVRTVVFVFVASVFVGNNWALWVGAGMYVIPKVIELIDDKFPNISVLHRYLPRALFKVVVMMFVARWWGSTLSSMIDDSEQVIQLGFIFAGLPGLILTVLGWFGRESKKWPSTAFTKVMGIVLLVVGFLTVQGFIF